MSNKCNDCCHASGVGLSGLKCLSQKLPRRIIKERGGSRCGFIYLSCNQDACEKWQKGKPVRMIAKSEF